ncbi:hypothetical protein D9611_004973 [Ephemerocybe angulata]|uniref:F-box domain-containing protein n=1 Tax=Ephemerocybe angulata TaxID=980116 RepID=A0A8H5B2R5_9AGAR|nr:hypothetical protein D9611_004973 [Tulosesus angulatus]
MKLEATRNTTHVDRDWDAESREQLGQRMRVMESDLLKVRTKYNSLAKINTLPAEIMSSIFLMVMASLKGLNPPARWQGGRLVGRIGPDISWINVTHVCRHWREVALDCATLWSTLLFCTPELTEAMTIRSKNAPLSFKFDCYDNRFNDVVSRILSQPQRLRSVEISGLLHPALLDKSSRSAPFLERLVLTPLTSLPKILLPTNFLQGGAVCLKHLELQHFHIPSWEQLPLGPHLTLLELKLTTSGKRPSAQPFLESLQAMPLLQHLSLFDFLPEGDYPKHFSDDSEPPPLPDLRALELSDTSAAITGFFATLTVPQTAKVAVYLTDTDPEIEISPLSQLLVNLRKGWKGLEEGVQRLILEEEYLQKFDIHEEYLQLQLYRKRSIEVKSNEYIRPDLLINLRSDHDLHPHAVFSTIAAQLDLSQLMFLSVLFESYILTPETWISAFGALEGLKSITVGHTVALSLIEALGEDPAFQADGSVQPNSTLLPPHFPNLSNITFCSVDFGLQTNNPSAFISYIQQTITVFRRKIYPCIALEISTCSNFRQEHLEQLEGMGIEVDWDLHNGDMHGQEGARPILYAEFTDDEDNEEGEEGNSQASNGD